eukprot:g71859.t1
MSCWGWYRSFFRNNPTRDAVIYLVLLLVLWTVMTVCMAAEWLRPPCEPLIQSKEFRNPKYNSASCEDQREAILLFLTPRECDFGRRLVVAGLLGALIGYERRSPDRPAGIRTMAVTALGSATFTLSSMFAFEDSSMGWDSSRVSAAIPSGVGFLGAGLIFKQGTPGDGTPQVVGLTTAASLWLSAAVGVCAGGAMYVPAVMAVALVVFILRFGPRSDGSRDNETAESDGEDEQVVSLAASYQAEDGAGKGSGQELSMRSLRRQSSGTPNITRKATLKD